jgi:hypothetical protein
MTERTEPRLPQVGGGRDGEGHEGMFFGASPAEVPW